MRGRFRAMVGRDRRLCFFQLKVFPMKPILLIAAVLVLPLVWGYLAEQLLRRIWPGRAETSADWASSQGEDDNQTAYLDFQI